MASVIASVIRGYAWFAIIYFAVLNSIYLVLITLAALDAVAQPLIEEPRRMVAAGATIRVANACQIRGGRVVDVHMPGGWLAPIQAVEYLRSFLLGRAGWSQIRGMLLISGAFGLFRRDVYELAGGVDLEPEGDDVELVAGMHHHRAQWVAPDAKASPPGVKGMQPV